MALVVVLACMLAMTAVNLAVSTGGAGYMSAYAYHGQCQHQTNVDVLGIHHHLGAITTSTSHVSTVSFSEPWSNLTEGEQVARTIDYVSRACPLGHVTSALTSRGTDQWKVYLDSGCMHHCFGNDLKDKFYNVTALKKPYMINTAAPQRLIAPNRGSIGKLHGVLCVERLTVDLISIGDLVRGQGKDKMFDRVSFGSEGVYGDTIVDANEPDKVVSVKIGFWDKHGMACAVLSQFGLDDLEGHKQSHTHNLQRRQHQLVGGGYTTPLMPRPSGCPHGLYRL